MSILAIETPKPTKPDDPPTEGGEDEDPAVGLSPPSPGATGRIIAALQHEVALTRV